MGILGKPFLLDIIIIFFVMIMMILGYKKGFVVRLYDFATTLLALLIAYTVADSLSQVWVIYSLAQPLTTIGEKVNQFFIFIIIFFIFKLACKILGIFIKPVIKKLFSIFKITQFLDSLLGLILSVLESLVFIYLAMVIIISPVFSGGKEMIQQSILGNTITKTVPLYAMEMMKFDIIQDFSNLDLNTKDTTCVTLVTEVLFQLDENEFIDDDSLALFMVNYYHDIEQVSINQETYEMIEQMCQKHQLDSEDILKGIIVSDENEE